MADEGMSEDEAQALASVVRRQTDHDVEVLPEDGRFAVGPAERAQATRSRSETHRTGSS